MSKSVKRKHEAFRIHDCALAAIATGQQAQNLKELRNNIAQVEPDSILYHFWGVFLKPRFEDPEFNNDFASWVRHALHDKTLAERLGVLNPADFPDTEELRKELIEVIEERLDSIEYLSWCEPDEQFYFITTQLVVFDTHKVIHKAAELATTVPAMTTSSIFYHFIEARRRTFGRMDDFRSWLYGFDGAYTDLIDLLSTVDPFFSTLTELREQLGALFKGYFKGAR
jgi:hypothetical protein